MERTTLGRTGLALDAGDDWFDVAMVGFNLLNPSARGRLLAAAQARGVGVLVMFAVRRALSDPEVCRSVVADLDWIRAMFGTIDSVSAN